MSRCFTKRADEGSRRDPKATEMEGLYKQQRTETVRPRQLRDRRSEGRSEQRVWTQARARGQCVAVSWVWRVCTLYKTSSRPTGEQQVTSTAQTGNDALSALSWPRRQSGRRSISQGSWWMSDSDLFKSGGGPLEGHQTSTVWLRCCGARPRRCGHSPGHPLDASYCRSSKQKHPTCLVSLAWHADPCSSSQPQTDHAWAAIYYTFAL